jgi:hypothetical protein
LPIFNMKVIMSNHKTRRSFLSQSALAAGRYMFLHGLLGQPSHAQDNSEVRAIVGFIKHGGLPLDIERIDSRWIGNPVQYDGLVKLLRIEPGTSDDWADTGDDWTKGLVALAVVAAGNPELAAHALVTMETFSTDPNYFGQPAIRLPQYRTENGISPHAYFAKAEVPHAVALLAQQTNDKKVQRDAIDFLKKGANGELPEYKWSAEGYFGGNTIEERNTSRSKFFGARFSQVLQSFKALARLGHHGPSFSPTLAMRDAAPGCDGSRGKRISGRGLATPGI